MLFMFFENKSEIKRNAVKLEQFFKIKGGLKILVSLRTKELNYKLKKLK